MTWRPLSLVLLILIVGAIFAVPRAQADGTNGIEFQATDLSGSLWQYTYTLTGPALNANQAFTIFFDPTLTANLTDTSADTTLSGTAATEWFSFTIPPDPTLNSQGFYSAEALVNGADPTTDSFTVTFNYLGTGAPGSQAFSIDQFDAYENLLSNLETGQTTPFSAAVPEPESGLLLVLGTAVLLGLTFRSR